MSEDRLFADVPPSGGFVFDETVADVFDDMIARSVPFYAEQQRMIAELATAFWSPGSLVYDLGCSTGATLIQLVQSLGPDARAVGYDSSRPMLARASANVARAGLAARVDLRAGDLECGPDTFDL